MLTQGRVSLLLDLKPKFWGRSAHKALYRNGLESSGEGRGDGMLRALCPLGSGKGGKSSRKESNLVWGR